ncbi:hypothetical protein C0Q70_18222 [Pomacea canaliculata]|uniref:MADF domain-containing protein n=2 Tax=Pomacea canaliculata TaxID=400727 RepID=A0A2T7NMK9_POMCA|nr:hypothetical protein C0Q70_18222 [Pomacea canaliculata]
MLESMMICLTPEETDAFIDIWQQHSCLWQVHDPGYKSKTARAHAMQDIADTFARGWTIDQVRRKIESLKTYWREQRNKANKTTRTGLPAKVWSHYDRLNSFLGGESCTSEGIPNSWTRQTTISSVQRKTVNVEVSNEGEALEDGASSASSTSSDIGQIVTLHATSPSSPSAIVPHATQKRSMDRSRMSPLSQKKRMLSHVNATSPSSSSDVLENAVTDLIQEIRENHKQKIDDPLFTYAKTVADRLREIKNKRRLLVVKNNIDQFIHAALMEEMGDDV